MMNKCRKLKGDRIRQSRCEKPEDLGRVMRNGCNKVIGDPALEDGYQV